MVVVGGYNHVFYRFELSVIRSQILDTLENAPVHPSKQNWSDDNTSGHNHLAVGKRLI